MSADERTGARAEAARVFDAAMRESGTKNNELGVDEKRVRRWRSDDDADLEAAPPTTALLHGSWELFEAWVARARAARTELHGAPTHLTPEAALADAAMADSDVARESFAALADGHLSPTECPTVIAAKLRSEAKWAIALPVIRRREKR